MKKIVSLSFVLLTMWAVKSCKEAKKEDKGGVNDVENTSVDIKQEMVPKTVSFMMEPKSGSNVSGKITFTETNGTVKMMAVLTGLSEGEHAIHIHQKADCSADDATSTGGHWNPTNEPHGKWGDTAGYHKGDIGNLTADANGNATLEFATDQWCLGCDDQNKNIMGKAIIVHQEVDDFTTQPTGAAGARVSCTGIIQ